MIHHSDCLDILRTLPDGSVDMILQDPPYNMTACKWECKLDLPTLWKEWERVIKENGAIVMTSSQPFTSELLMSNRPLFKYEMIWCKNTSSGSVLANKRPMKKHENILVFYKKQPIYNKQYFETESEMVKSHCLKGYKRNGDGKTEHFPGIEKGHISGNFKLQINPHTLLKFNTVNPRDKSKIHPTQKPVSLFRYLIRTYTNEGEIVFDGYAGSGTTAVACHLENRKYICCERELQYYEIAIKRIVETIG